MSAHPKYRVLVIDDEPVIHELVREVLDDYEILSAFTAAEARLVTERGDHFDVALVDKNLPDLSGLELVRWLREKRSTCEIVIITAYPSMDSALEAMSLGAIDYLIKPMRDINELRLRVGNACDRATRRRAEDRLVSQLRESEERYRGLFEASPDAVLVICDATRTIVDANHAAEQLYGRTREQLVGAHAAQLTCATPDPTVRDGVVVRRDRRADQSTFPVEVSIGSARRDDRTFVVEVVRDVSERERAEVERLELEKRLARAGRLEALGRLAAGVAHDVNNMLCVIRTSAELAVEALPVDSRAREDLAPIETAVVSAADLTRQLLTFSGRQLACPRVLDIHEVVQGVVKMLGRTLEARVKLVLDLSEFPAFVKIDPGQLEQVLTNLAVNARDAMPNGGTITITTRVVETEPRVCLSIRDTGVGIPAEICDEIFEPFFTTKGAHGTGIGLATAHEVVTRNGGRISVESQVGVGTRFEIRLPWSSEQLADRSVAFAIPVIAGRGEQILIVEDDLAVLHATRRLLGNAGYAVHDASSAEHALDLLRDKPFALVLADIDLPGMSGIELARKLKTPVVFTSGMASDPSRLDGFPFLPKPYSADDLLRCVRKVLDRR